MIVTVNGSLKDINGTAITERTEITVQLNENSVQYDDDTNAYIVNGKVKTIYPDGSGDWTINLVDTDSMPTGTYYIFYIAGQEYRKLVAASTPVSFEDLEDYTS